MLQRWLKKFGHVPTVLLVSLLIGLVSMISASLIRLLLGLPHTLAALLIALFLPIVIAAPILSSLFNTVAELDETRQRLQVLATIDQLTGVPNRAHFIKLATEALMEAPEAEPVGMIIIDVDRFKLINDTYGHLVGDEALQLIARTISVQLREGDIFGRFAGDEFILLAPNTTPGEIQSLCHIMLTHIQTLSVGVNDVRTRLNATMGVTSAVPSAVSLNDLIARADTALLQAKRMGGGRVRFI